VKLQALVMNSDDNVATAVRSLKRGETVNTEVGVNDTGVLLVSDIPFGHKLAMKDIARGADIVKYGEVIGRAVAGIQKGEHVHVHNVEGLRGRGDKS
jgi:altronate dehydratase small subunit